MSPIGRLQSEGDLERFISDQGAQQTQAFRAQLASLVQATQGMVLADAVATGEATAAGPYVDLATVGPTVTVGVAGTYVVLWGAQFTAGSAVTPYITLTVNGSSTALEERRATLSTGTGFSPIMGVQPRALAAGDVLGVRYGSQAAISVTFSHRFLVALRLSS